MATRCPQHPSDEPHRRAVQDRQLDLGDVGGNLTRTAAELFVHVNTLYQRLDRVTALIRPGWRCGDSALQVHLALTASRAFGADR